MRGMDKKDWTDEFNGRVLAWVQQRYPAVAIVSVRGSGSDWAGDTEGGFYSRFDVSIRWANAQGQVDWMDVNGEDMDSLWRALVS